jgi:putative FmdB family regulatory protein
MPLYDYKCRNCGEIIERFSKIEGCPESIRCWGCGEMAYKIISVGHGGIQCDSETDVPWLKSACRNLLPDDHRPLETRGQYKRYLKEKGIVERA